MPGKGFVESTNRIVQDKNGNTEKETSPKPPPFEDFDD
jgi:hypothetical protein